MCNDNSPQPPPAAAGNPNQPSATAAAAAGTNTLSASGSGNDSTAAAASPHNRQPWKVVDNSPQLPDVAPDCCCCCCMWVMRPHQRRYNSSSRLLATLPSTHAALPTHVCTRKRRDTKWMRAAENKAATEGQWGWSVVLVAVWHGCQVVCAMELQPLPSRAQRLAHPY